ncbi:MAG: Ig-like domain-containing protein [Treponema sp.]|nr:Ig-like domain-containing protein [Treponema sp.]
MKKHLRITCNLLFLATSFSLISCEGFFQGSALKQEIEAEIQANKTPIEIQYSPEGTGPYPKNTQILIQFSQAMNVESVNNQIKIGSSAGSTDYCGNYISLWSEDNKTLTLKPDEYNLIDLRGSDTATIYVEIPARIKSSEGIPLLPEKKFHFNINNELDNAEPVFNSLQVYFYDSVLFNGDLSKARYFEEGELTSSKRDSILTNNLVKNAIQITTDGHDYGGGKVKLHSVVQQLTDVSGNPVSKEKQESFYELKDSSKEFESSFCSSFEIKLAPDEDPAFTDGLYKMTLTMEDEAGNASNPKVFYVVRDNILEVSDKAYVFQALPDLRRDKYGKLHISDWDAENIRNINQIDVRKKGFMKEKFSDDTYYTYINGTDTKTYKTSSNDFIIKLSYGLKYEIFDVLQDEVIAGEFGYNLSDRFIKYLSNHEDSNVFVRVDFFDKVGNYSYKDICIPAKPGFMYYTYNSSNNKINIKVIDKSSLDLGSYLGTSQIRGTATYQVFYAKKDGTTDIKDLTLSRTGEYRLDLGHDDFDDISDPFSLTIDPNSSYVVAIQTKYNFQNENDWLGSWYSPFCIIDNVTSSYSSQNTIKTPEFTYEKINNGKNSGSFTIKIKYQNKESDVKYYPAWSTDGINYSYYESNLERIVVPTPVFAPIYDGGDYYKYYKANIENADLNNKIIRFPEYTNTAYLKILAVKGETCVESEPQKVEFLESDDNTAPEISTWSRTHSLVLTGDLKYYHTPIGSIEDKGWHQKDTFTFYWTPFNPNWGNKTNIYTAEQIEALPNKGTGFIKYNYSHNSEKIEKSSDMYIPLEGMENGDYMFFMKIEDIYGNYTYGTMGKGSIHSFKNKINAQYSSTNNELDISLKLDASEKFNSHIFQIDFYNFLDQEMKYQWEKFSYTKDVKEKDGVISLITPVIKGDWTPENRFFKVHINSSNFNPKSGYVNMGDYGYFDTKLSEYEEEGGYDPYSDETFTTPKYVYVSSAGEDPVSAKIKYFNSAAGYNPVLWTDIPALVEIFKSDKNLGNDIDEWIRRGTLIDSKIYNSRTWPEKDKVTLDATSYTQIDTSIVNKTAGSFYYVVTVHFADGTNDMSVVYQK